MIKGPGMIGSNKCKIDSECNIQGSVIGNNSCTMEKNVCIMDSHLWDNVTAEDGATI